jgi:hypothetical protein
VVFSSRCVVLARGRVPVERSVMEQRFDAVMAVVRDGRPVTEVAAEFGVSRQVGPRLDPPL